MTSKKDSMNTILMWIASQYITYAEHNAMPPNSLTLTLCRKRPPSGFKIRLFGRSGPYGEVLSCVEEGAGQWRVNAVFEHCALFRVIAKYHDSTVSEVQKQLEKLIRTGHRD